MIHNYTNINHLDEKDILNLYHYLYVYSHEICKAVGEFNHKDEGFIRFRESNKILFDSINQQSKELTNQYPNYILYNSQDKKSKCDNGYDRAHQVLRHIRNSIAHCKIESIESIENSRTVKKFKLHDSEEKKGKQITKMEAVFEKNIFFDFIESLINTKN